MLGKAGVTSPTRQVVTRDEAGVRPYSRQVVTEHFCAKNNNVSLLAVTPLACHQTACRQPAKRRVVSRERETGLEPATACLEGRRSRSRRSPGLHRPYSRFHTIYLQCERAWQKMSRAFFTLLGKTCHVFCRGFRQKMLRAFVGRTSQCSIEITIPNRSEKVKLLWKIRS